MHHRIQAFDRYRLKAWIISFLFVLGITSPATAAFKAVLQGQTRLNTNWIAGNLKGWREMDAVPCRVYLTGGPINSRDIVISFDRLQAGKAAIDDLSGFTTSSNVVLISAPRLNAPAKSGVWSYALKVKLLDRKPGYVTFNARLAAGAHRNVGSSVALRGTPSLGTLQIHKPAAGLPDLSLVKQGPAEASPGDVITYTLTYSNKVGVAAAECVKIVDRLPPHLAIIRESATNAQIFGSTIVWRPGTIAAGGSSRLTYQARIKGDAPCHVLFTNCAVITSKGDRHKPRDDDDGDDDDDDGSGHDDDDDDDYSKQGSVRLSGAGEHDDDDDGGHDDDDDGGHDDDDDGDCQDKKCEKGEKCGSHPDANPADNTARWVTRTICNTPPVAANDSYAITRDSSLSLPAPGVLGNDSDADSDPLSAYPVTAPLHGILALMPDGSFRYQPPKGFTGSDTFIYAASDGKHTSTARVTVVVQAVNRAPAAADDFYHTQRDMPLVVPAPGVLVNDTDEDGDVLLAQILRRPAHGELTLNANGEFHYQPHTNFVGSDSFIYAAGDGTESSAATVRIMVQAVNRPPAGAADSYQASRNASLAIGAPGVLANDSDPDGDALVAVMSSGAAHGTVSLSPNGSFIYAPASGFTGVDTFTYVVRDLITESAPITVTITVGGTNVPPQTSITAPTNGAVYIEGMDFVVSADASDADGQVTQVDLREGAAVLGSFTGEPYAVRLTNVTAGEYVFRAAATDNDGAMAESTPVTVTVLVNPPFSVGPFQLNRQTGLFEQVVRVTNPTPDAFAGIRLWIDGVRPGAAVWNRTAISEGIPYIEAVTVVPAGESLDILVEYYTPDVRIAPEPVYVPQLIFASEIE